MATHAHARRRPGARGGSAGRRRRRRPPRTRRAHRGVARGATSPAALPAAARRRLVRGRARLRARGCAPSWVAAAPANLGERRVHGRGARAAVRRGRRELLAPRRGGAPLVRDGRGLRARQRLAAAAGWAARQLRLVAGSGSAQLTRAAAVVLDTLGADGCIAADAVRDAREREHGGRLRGPARGELRPRGAAARAGGGRRRRRGACRSATACTSAGGPTRQDWSDARAGVPRRRVGARPRRPARDATGATCAAPATTTARGSAIARTATARPRRRRGGSAAAGIDGGDEAHARAPARAARSAA